MSSGEISGAWITNSRAPERSRTDVDGPNRLDDPREHQSVRSIRPVEGQQSVPPESLGGGTGFQPSQPSLESRPAKAGTPSLPSTKGATKRYRRSARPFADQVRKPAGRLPRRRRSGFPVSQHTSRTASKETPSWARRHPLDRGAGRLQAGYGRSGAASSAVKITSGASGSSWKNLASGGDPGRRVSRTIRAGCSPKRDLLPHREERVVRQDGLRSPP